MYYYNESIVGFVKKNVRFICDVMPPLRSRHPYDPLPSYGRTRIRLMLT